MRHRLLSTVAFCSALALLAGRASAAPGQVFELANYGGVGDGKTSNTEAFQKAITACNAAGGGMVNVPKGEYLTGPIQLLSNVELHVEEGALVQFSRTLSDFPLVRSNWEGRDTFNSQSPLWGDNVHNVSFTGQGIFDGGGDAWRIAKKEKFTADQWDAKLKAGGYVDPNHPETWYPSEAVFQQQKSKELGALRASKDEPKQVDYEKFHDVLRPSLMLLTNATNVVLDGPTFRNSPSWNIHLLFSDNITVKNTTLYNEPWGQNTDGIDIDSCRNVEVAHCKVYAGDDDICIKSGRDEAGRKVGRPTENVTIRNCDIFWGHGGVVVGSEMSGGVRNITVSNCIMRGTNIGLRFKTTRGRGGTVENIDVSNVAMHDIKGAAISLDMYYMVKPSKTVFEVNEGTPTFRRFSFKNITCEGAKAAIDIRGLPEQSISGITLDTVRMKADRGISLTDAQDVTLRDVQVEAAAGPGLQTAGNVSNLTLERVNTKAAEPTTQPTRQNDDGSITPATSPTTATAD